MIWPLLLTPAALLAAPVLLTPLRERLTPRELAPAGRFVTIDGHEIHFSDTGPDTAPAVMLVHGFAASTFTWRAQIAALCAAGYRAIAVDLLGYGASARPASAVYATDQQARVVLGVADALAVPQFALVGHSFGGRVALQLALLAPERVTALVAICPEALALTRPPIGALTALPLVGQALSFYLLAPGLVSTGLRALSVRHEWLTAEAAAGYAAPLTVRGTAMAQVWQARSPKDGSMPVPTALEQITCPTLLLWGDRDTVFPVDDGRQLAQRMPAARLEVFHDVGHLPHEECADAVSTALLTWLATLR